MFMPERMACSSETNCKISLTSNITHNETENICSYEMMVHLFLGEKMISKLHVHACIMYNRSASGCSIACILASLHITSTWHIMCKTHQILQGELVVVITFHLTEGNTVLDWSSGNFWARFQPLGCEQSHACMLSGYYLHHPEKASRAAIMSRSVMMT